MTQNTLAMKIGIIFKACTVHQQVPCLSSSRLQGAPILLLGIEGISHLCFLTYIPISFSSWVLLFVIVLF
jgi:hypothetical protein